GIYDSTTGLYYLNARYYNPEDGRFLTEDTYRGETEEPDTWHLYAYCKNNPVNYKDPSGHVAIPAGYYMAMYVPGFGQVLLGATVVVVGGYAVYKGGSWIYKKIKKVVKKKKIKGK